MTKHATLRCPTPKCVDVIARFGEQYHRVTDTEFRKYPTCEHCGGKYIDDAWLHECKTCKRKDVEPGTLQGLFVPHDCPTCADKHRADSRRCGICGTNLYDCCC